jgi:hypothetical protein
MNFKKAALFIVLSISAFPAIASARPSKNNRAASPVKHVSLGILSRIVTPGHKKQPVVTDQGGNRKAAAGKPR